MVSYSKDAAGRDQVIITMHACAEDHEAMMRAVLNLLMTQDESQHLSQTTLCYTARLLDELLPDLWELTRKKHLPNPPQ